MYQSCQGVTLLRAKAVYVRTTLDTWSTHFDLLAEYISGSSDGLTDCFSFRLTLVPPFGEQGARVDFCLRYETPVGTFWTNNNNQNYVLSCHHRVKERNDKPQMESVSKKSCLKPVSQNFSIVENTSAMEESSQENISTDVSKHGEGEDTVKAKQISDGQSGKSDEEQQKLQAENRRNCSRKNRRRARVRDLFAQRNGGTNDNGRDDSPPEAKQAAQEETPEEKLSGVQSSPEKSSKSEQFVSESTEANREPLLDAEHDTSPAHDCVSNSQSEKSESTNLADSTTSRGGESATDKPGNTFRLAEHQNINKSGDTVENDQKQGMSYECTSNTAAEPADSAVLSADSKSLVSQANSFTFTTVVAPLYHQVFGRVGSETHTSDDPARATLNVGDLTQSHPHTEGREVSCSVPKDADGDKDKAQGIVINSQESNQECLDATLNSPPTEEEESSLSVTANDILDCADALQDPVEITQSDQRCTNSCEVSGDAVIHPHTASVSNADFSNSQIPTESLHLRGEAQEDDLTRDVRSQTTEGTAQAHPPEQTRTQADVDEALTENKTEEVISSLENSFMSLQPTQSEPESISDETGQQTSSTGANDKDINVGKTAAISTTNGISEKDTVSEALRDLVPNHINYSAPKEAASSCVSFFKIVEEKHVTTPQISLETQEETNHVEEENKVTNGSCKDETTGLTLTLTLTAEIKITGEVAESTSQTMTSSYHTHSEMLTESEDKDALKDEDIIVSEKRERYDVKAAVSEQEEFCLLDTTVVKNWEMMVEEEEKNTLTDEDQSEAASLKAGDVEAAEKDRGGQVEDTGIETVSESRDTAEEKEEKTEDVMVGEITVEREKENKAKDVDKQRIGEEEIGEIVAEKSREESDRDLGYFQNKTAEEEELAEETEGEKREEDTELEEEKHLAEIQGVNIENVQEEEETEREEEMEIDLNDSDESGVELEDQVEPREENAEEENPDYKEEILVDETRESEIVDAESESMTIEDRGNEVWCLEERLDVSQNKAEGGLSALMNSVHDERKAARDENEYAAEGSLFVFTDQPESELTDNDGTSAESDSDDEVELYMHCLRAVHTGAQASKAKNKDTGFNVGKRPSISRGKLLSAPMPSIRASQSAHVLLDGAPVRRSVRSWEKSGGSDRRRQQHGGSVRLGAMDLRDNVETGETENHPELFYVPIPDEAPRKREQEKLSGVVKSVHRKLRRKYREVGDFDKIWREHCEDEQTLSEYALAMKNLADSHWTKNCEGEGRIEWCRSVCQEYFLDGGMKRMLEKDEKSATLAMGLTGASVSAQPYSTIPSSISQLGKMRLLDVGSCFNPFLKFDEFLTVGIDIVPAVESVYKCDFLNLQLQQPLQLAGDAVEAFLRQLHNPIDTLPAQLFHVVVFSLLLSYFPSPYQRWICCKKAHELLELHGLLLIITPDSSHQNRHALMMRSWRVAVESLGFKRYKYVKYSHMHLIAFRKVCLATTSDLVSRNYPEMLYIPQDFHSNEEEECADVPVQVRSEFEDDQLAWGFTELPDTPYDSDSGESQSSSVPGFYELEDPILLQS
ncbi:hypothetical protein L3Q82_023738 [Scortum barcoo]|uniref:Uncharacterized protein n=1 Tax=Scortum barcoo TaxID=214431 RepID=A0ACB8WTQ6_9TELE|nr:hypothetical protein L3Q82_023738 [Scortum barcoo]